MEAKIEKAFEIASLMATLNSQKRLLEEEFEQTLLYYYNGGVFKATEQRLAFLASIKSKDVESIVLLDDNKTPILVENIDSFFNDLFSHYTEATNHYYYQHKKITSSKTVESIIENV
jgi:hypothetical protein